MDGIAVSTATLLSRPAKNQPVLTMALCVAAILFHVMPESGRELFYFDPGQLRMGNLGGLVFSHWLHVDWPHLTWNVAALALLGGMLERQSRALYCASLVAGTVAVDVLLLSPLSTVERYCGLSGVLNAVLGCLLYVMWLRTRSRIVIAVAALALSKITVEMVYQQSLFTEIAWPPYSAAHLAGVLAAVILCVIVSWSLSIQGRIARSAG